MSVANLIWVTLLALTAVSARADDRTARLERGELIVEVVPRKGQSVALVKVTTVFAAPAERIWPLLDRCGDYKATMMRVAEAEELSRHGSTVRCRVVVEMPFPFDNITSVTEAKQTVKPGKGYRRRWRQVEGDFRVNSGQWQLTPYGDGQRTLAVYEVIAAPKLDVPDSIRIAAQKESLPGLFAHIRRQVEAH